MEDSDAILLRVAFEVGCKTCISLGPLGASHVPLPTEQIRKSGGVAQTSSFLRSHFGAFETRHAYLQGLFFLTTDVFLRAVSIECHQFSAQPLI